MTACKTADYRLNAASAKAEQARQEQKAGALVDQALELSRPQAPQPKECGQRIKSGVQVGERLDVALTKTDDALTRANNRLVRCYTFNQRARGK